MAAWTEDLAVGVPYIDAQHRELFARVDLLLKACNQGTAREEVGHLLRFLEDYVLTHFDVEEQLMLVQAYPAFSEHKAEHQFFVDQLGQLKEKYHSDGPALSLILLTVKTAAAWLREHIRKTDRAVGAFVLGREKTAGAGRDETWNRANA